MIIEIIIVLLALIASYSFFIIPIIEGDNMQACMVNTPFTIPHWKTAPKKAMYFCVSESGERMFTISKPIYCEEFDEFDYELVRIFGANHWALPDLEQKPTMPRLFSREEGLIDANSYR